MMILALNPGHDGAVAVVADGRLLLSVEGEKDSFPRHEPVTPMAVLAAAKYLYGSPDVIAIGGWHKRGTLGLKDVGSGYSGHDRRFHTSETLFGRQATFFSSTHERSHILMALGMAPDDGPHEFETVLVWEGGIGSFYVVDNRGHILKNIPVLREPGARYAFLYSLADPLFPDSGTFPNLEDSGKLMALASYGDEHKADQAITATVEEILKLDSLYPAPKNAFRTSPLYNSGPESAATKIAAASMTRRLFDCFARAARSTTPRGSPLRISGGCGLNCTWNQLWRNFDHFSSVFVPPCTNDSGSAIGTAIDAYNHLTGRTRIAWTVYCGLDFERDREPAAVRWARKPVEYSMLTAALVAGDIVAWVQGRWEIGPRALGNRSLLAEPFDSKTRDRLNEIKQREGYRPIAPCCRAEETATLFMEPFADPYMLYTRQVRSQQLRAVTHVDGSARLQTVTEDANPDLYRLLTAFAHRTGAGVLCNTSLNFKGKGFINRMSDLAMFCESRGVKHMVVGQDWYTHI